MPFSNTCSKTRHYYFIIFCRVLSTLNKLCLNLNLHCRTEIPQMETVNNLQDTSLLIRTYLLQFCGGLLYLFKITLNIYTMWSEWLSDKTCVILWICLVCSFALVCLFVFNFLCFVLFFYLVFPSNIENLTALSWHSRTYCVVHFMKAIAKTSIE